ncbi:hypothetical protein Ade02nite_44930 [Paractinoplanes deccanensis]|uniref:Uncharacterized protein n=1 Tax=Paractinoplanes deccanensis TaxID=113561 RepID=A0ABQ3Y772_9ACTN|nr:hypothetical protein [Actinoplanes deccanensis]GID75852.1 hypothetical protein Ade02nite_44930 [Actinoplanes deccanensis]
MRIPRSLVLAAVAALGVRVVKSRRQRFLHPRGRVYEGELHVWGGDCGAALLDRPGRHPVTVRISKGLGVEGDRPDVRGVALRVHGDEPIDLLLSTCGKGRFTRHLPVPRRGYETFYGSILAYRTGDGRKVYLGATLSGDTITLDVDGHPVGQAVMGTEVGDSVVFDPIRHTAEDLHPTGTIHGARGLAYPLSQWWRGVRRTAPSATGTARAISHR